MDTEPSIQSLVSELEAEFARLNTAHFAGRLRVPEIVVSRRKTYGGYYQPARHRIVVSYQAFREHGQPEMLNTFRHEVAHIVHPNHSRAFWALALELGAAQRHASAPLARPPVRFLYGCPACGRQMARRSRLRRASSCGACDKKYNPQYQLQLIKSRRDS